ncbi:hypothetical protein D1BOALGB6SA_3578 [Olavius sp. associated proteobacterium Delta 1]|nr:hypothetical protein D1BOALGB6SA_3578 [Olavius sp. associated proteobacterium Delta 1]
MRETLEKKVRAEVDYKKARTRQIRLLKKGLDLGTEGQVKISRDELLPEDKSFIDTSIILLEGSKS